MDAVSLRPRKQISWGESSLSRGIKESSVKSTASSTSTSATKSSSLKTKTVSVEAPAASSSSAPPAATVAGVVEVVVETPGASTVPSLPLKQQSPPPRPDEVEISVSISSSSYRRRVSNGFLAAVAAPLAADGLLTIKSRTLKPLEGIPDEDKVAPLNPLLKLVQSVCGLAAGRSIWGLEPYESMVKVAALVGP